MSFSVEFVSVVGKLYFTCTLNILYNSDDSRSLIVVSICDLCKARFWHLVELFLACRACFVCVSVKELSLE